MYNSLLLVLVFGCMVIWPTLHRDDEGYAQLVKSSEPKEMRAYCQQFREGVTKEVWGDQNCQLASEQSELFFFNHNGEIELIEEMDAISCILQEERFIRNGEPWQLVRLLQAQSACFNYNTQLLTAEDVQMWSYEIPGHTTPQTIDADPFMEGKADIIELQMMGKQFDITAHDFEGKML